MSDRSIEPVSVTDTAAELIRRRVPFVHATVVRAQKPTSAHAGDTALIRADGVIDGFVGGTCAESSVREYGADGAVEQRAAAAADRAPARRPADAEEGAVTVANPCLSGGSMEIFLEPRVPAPRVLVVGDSPIAEALAALGGPLGFAVDLVAGRGAAAEPDDAALVVASHGRGEEPALTAALRLGVPYVALIASRIRGAAVLASLDVTDEQRAGCTSRPAWTSAPGPPPRSPCRCSPSWSPSAGRRERTAPAAAPPRRGPRRRPGLRHDRGGSRRRRCTSTVDGVATWFCCPGCRTAFLADPARYAPAS